MRSSLIFCIIVGLCYAADYGWKNNTEYTYKINGRTLSSINNNVNQYAGIIMKSDLIIRPVTEGKLMAMVTNSYYAKIHTKLPNGWKGELPEQKLEYEPFPLTNKPFEIIFQSGIVTDLIVSKDVENWEANMLKSIVSQIQLDTQGKNAIKSHITQMPEVNSSSAVFKTIEETITGKFKTLYDIFTLPEYTLQLQPWLVPKPELKGDGEFIEIVKTKNFSQGYEHIGYHYGLGNNREWEPSTNKMGDFFLRSSVSRCIISGKLAKYNIQSCTTTNKIIVSPTLNNKDKSIVVSFMNVTLFNVKPVSGISWEVKEPRHLNSLVYSYSIDGYAKNKKSQSNDEGDYSSEESIYREDRRTRLRRYDTSNSSSEDDYTDLTEAPQTPLLAMLVGYNGTLFKGSEKINSVEVVKNICETIGNDVLKPDAIPNESTLARYTLLVRLVRALSEKEIKRVADYLYTDNKDGRDVAVWRVFRDAVGEAGTGPALLIIKEWIISKKVYSEEAAELVAVMAQAVRIPSKTFIRTFYSMVTKAKSQRVVNDTALLAFASLVRKIYVTKEFPYNHFPIKSFDRSNYEKDGEVFVVNEFIPYLKEKMEQAVESGDSHKILVCIRALGNVAHKKILAVFEPYLEGTKKISKFQRLQIILAMDKLVSVNPKVSRSVMYKVYQNSGEVQEVRVAAVYQLMRTIPPSSMLQRMAQYTNVDVHEQVNAAVKSSIQSAAAMEGDDYAEFSENARSAEPLLTKQTYGYQYSYNFLANYVVGQMNLIYRQSLQTFGSLDSLLPKGFNYHITTKLGGFKDELVNIQAMVSSIAELTNVIYRQSEEYQYLTRQNKKYYEKATQHKYSSETLDKILKLEVDESELLDGSFLFQLGGGATRFFTFNNKSFEALPQAIQDLEELLRYGKAFNYTKFLNRQDIAISFPTEMSIPFVYMLDAPTVISFNGEISVNAEPSISNGKFIRKPNSIEGRVTIRALFSTKVEAEVGFVTPFDHQAYTSGFHKNFHLYLPLQSEFELDFKAKEFSYGMQIMNPEETQRIFHFSTVPFTCNKDLMNFEPASKIGRTVKLVEMEKKTEFQSIVGRAIGIPLRITYSSEQKVMGTKWLYEQFKRNDQISSLFAPFYDEAIVNTKCDIEYAGYFATVKKIKIKFDYTRIFEEDDGLNVGFKLDGLSGDSENCHRYISKVAASGISKADVSSVYTSIILEGDNSAEYMICVAVGSGRTDGRSRALVLLKRKPQHYEAAIEIKSRFPYTDGIDFDEVVKLDPTSYVMTEMLLGENLQTGTRITAVANLTRSVSRLSYLLNSPRARECRREMQEGNKHQSACANVTEEANMLDRIKIKLRGENMTTMMKNMTYKLYDIVRYLTYFNFEENHFKPASISDKDEADISVRFHPTFDYVNISIETDTTHSDITNVRVNRWMKPIVAIHPAFPMEKRIMGEILNIDTFTPTCVVDTSSVTTFSNKSYPIALERAWTVMLEYSTKHKYVDGRTEEQHEHYAILVRDGLNSSRAKEVKMTVRTPQTSGRVIEIDMLPGYTVEAVSGVKPSAKVLINQQQHYFDNMTVSDMDDDLRDFVKVSSLPNGEVKIEIQNGFIITYEGGRIEISNVDQKFRNRAHGLCGKFNGQKYDDFLTPQNCVLEDPFEFAATYAIEETDAIRERKANALKSKCSVNKIVYSNVVSDYDAGRSDGRVSRSYKIFNASESCVRYQIRYVTYGKQVCFSVDLLPVCKDGCKVRNTIYKLIYAHCFTKTETVEVWMKEIDAGLNPGISRKERATRIGILLPDACSLNVANSL